MYKSYNWVVFFLRVLAPKHLWRCHLVAIMKSMILDSWQSDHLSWGAPSTEDETTKYIFLEGLLWCLIWFFNKLYLGKKNELLAKKKIGILTSNYVASLQKNCLLAGEAVIFYLPTDWISIKIAWVCLDRRSKICAAFSRTCWSIPWRQKLFMKVLGYWQLTPKEAFHGIHWNTVIIHN